MVGTPSPQVRVSDTFSGQCATNRAGRQVCIAVLCWLVASLVALTSSVLCSSASEAKALPTVQGQETQPRLAARAVRIDDPSLSGQAGAPSWAPQPPMIITAQTVVTSQPSACMAIDGDGSTLKSAASKMLFVWQGTPAAARLVLTSCGVKTGKFHTVYLNGQAAVQVRDDPYSSACACVSEGYTGQGGQTVTYSLPDAGLILQGWNYITITNDKDLWDDWVAYDAKLVLEGNVTQTLISSLQFISSFDGSTRTARYQLPIGYDPGEAVPLLVSIAGTKEDQKWEDLYRFAQQSNTRGWLLLSPNLRNLFGEVRGRTASLENQHDIIDAIKAMTSRFAVDTSRIYMSGFSTGGGVAGTVAAKYPDVFAAVADWAGPTDLGEWDQQVASLVNLDFGCWPSGFANPCPFEWQRRSVRSMSENLKHVPMVIVHGRADAQVSFEQSEKLYQKMAEYYDPAVNNKAVVWHDGGHADALPSFDGLQWMSQYTLNPAPTDIMIRADEDKSYYWITIQQRAWLGKVRAGWSAVLASYDLTSGVISATVQDQRLYENGFLPVDVQFDLAAMGLDPGATYSIEDYNVVTGEYVLTQGVHPSGNNLALSVERDEAGGVHHQYLVYPFAPPDLIRVAFQQQVSPSAGYSGAKDTSIYQYSPSANYAQDSRLTINYGRSFRGLLRFTLDTIPSNAEVKKAHLSLYLNRASDSGSLVVRLHRMLTPWIDTEANWNQAAQGQPWHLAGAGAPGSDYWAVPIEEKTLYQDAFWKFNLRSVVQDWLAVPSSNQGVLVLGPEVGSGSTWYRFDSSEAGDPSRRPMLEVWYMVPTATPSATPSPTPTSPSTGAVLEGNVSLQGRPPPPNVSWSVPLAVQVGTASYSVTTDQRGKFTLNGLSPGTYDVLVKNEHTLRVLRTAVSLVAGQTRVVDFGTLLEGDANNDNHVNITDFSLLATGFYPQYDRRVDFNQDSTVNITDFSLLASNFGMSGDIK